jgi:hypothetical protein
MNTDKSRRIDRRTAECLLDRGLSGIAGGHSPVAALLVAAAMPGRPHELTREHTTVAAFRTATLHPASQLGRLSVIKTATRSHWP